jgi:subtilase family serine protease
LLATSTTVFVIASVGATLGARAATVRSGEVRVGSTPPLASIARGAGGVAPGTRLHLTVALKPRDPAALAGFVRAVSTPGSSVYHAYLSPAQFADRFGASTAEVQAVQASLRAHGLTAGSATANRLAVPISGSAGRIEQAFAFAFKSVTVSGGRRATVASAAPALDRGIAGDVQAVIGLSSLPAPKPLLARSSPTGIGVLRLGAHVASHAAPAPSAACGQARASAGSQGAYTTDQIASAYGFADLYSRGSEGQGQTIAIYELESYDPSDIAAYQACYGIHARLTNIPVDGGSGATGPGSGEATLDIEQAVGLAPKANFLIYEAPNTGTNAPGSGPYDLLSRIIAQDRAHVVSISWGECEQVQGSNVLSAENTLFEEAAAQGQSVVAATGDNGSEDCNSPSAPNSQLAVDDPGSQRFVTGVGGTSLTALGPPPAETVWNRPGSASGPLVGQGGAGGGGVSDAWDMPGYQSNASRSLNVIGRDSSGSSCANPGGFCRQVPDVAADADPARGYLFYWNGSGADQGQPRGWQAVGGTSAGAPLWAALLADADSSVACRGSAIGFANPALYHAAGTSDASYFNDVVTGDNDFTGANNGLYPAGVGYDMASGLGSPKAGALAAALCADSLRVEDPGSQFSTIGQPVSLRITTTALAGAHLKFYASQLPPGLTISKPTGRISGRPKRIGKWLSGVAALDQNLSLRGAFFPWQVEGAPTVSGAQLSGVGAGHPKLVFAVGAGRAGLLLSAVSIRLSSGLSFGHTTGRVTVTGQGGRRLRFASRLVSGRLRILLGAPSWRIRITINSGAIRISAQVAADVRRNRPPLVSVAVMTTDSSGHEAPAGARIKPRS